MDEVVTITIDWLKRILGFIVIWYNVWAINVEASFHLIYDYKRISPNIYFTALDSILINVIKTIDETLVFSLIVGNIIPQIFVTACNTLRSNCFKTFIFADTSYKKKKPRTNLHRHNPYHTEPIRNQQALLIIKERVVRIWHVYHITLYTLTRITTRCAIKVKDETFVVRHDAQSRETEKEIRRLKWVMSQPKSDILRGDTERKSE